MENPNKQFEYRFSGLARLYGKQELDTLKDAHFVVIGLGGVGTWAAEALARSGIGELSLIELDEVCVSNTNRQLHALNSTVGKSKNAVISQRLKDINPDIKINSIEDFITKENLAELIRKEQDVVIDATDSAHIKAALAAYCSAIKVRLIISGSSGGKRDPRLVTVSDLGRTSADPMLVKIRSHLYRYHNFSREKNRKFRIDAVYSTEQMVYPQPDGSVCMDKSSLENGVKLDCASGYGSSVMVTGTFGFVAAAHGIDRFLQKKFPESYKN